MSEGINVFQGQLSTFPKEVSCCTCLGIIGKFPVGEGIGIALLGLEKIWLLKGLLMVTSRSSWEKGCTPAMEKLLKAGELTEAAARAVRINCVGDGGVMPPAEG